MDVMATIFRINPTQRHKVRLYKPRLTFTHYPTDLFKIYVPQSPTIQVFCKSENVNRRIFKL